MTSGLSKLLIAQLLSKTVKHSEVIHSSWNIQTQRLFLLKLLIWEMDCLFHKRWQWKSKKSPLLLCYLFQPITGLFFFFLFNALGFLIDISEVIHLNLVPSVVAVWFIEYVGPVKCIGFSGGIDRSRGKCRSRYGTTFTLCFFRNELLQVHWRYG